MQTYTHITQSPLLIFSVVKIFCCTYTVFSHVPYRWEIRKDEHGRTYYIDHNTCTTSWHRPIPESVRNYQEWRDRDLSDQRHRHQQRFLLVRSVVAFLLISTDNDVLLCRLMMNNLLRVVVRIYQKTGVSFTCSILDIQVMLTTY